MANLASSEDLYVQPDGSLWWHRHVQSAHSLRTKIYNYTSGMYLLADVAGAAINSLLLSDHVYLLNAISVSCFAVTAWIAMLIPEECARESITTEEAIPIVDSVDGFESSPTTSISLDRPVFAQQAKRRPHIISTLLNSWRASYHTLSTLFRAPNPTFTVLLLFAVNGFANNIQVLLFQYTSLVLSWPLATVNSALALKALVSAIMLLALPTFRKLILEPRLSTTSIDLLITQISLLLNALGMIGLGFSVSAILFIISLCVYTSGVGLGDSLTAYGTLTLPQHETVADFYVKTGLIQTITGLTAAPLWSLLFGLVIDARVLPLGIPFWLCATLYGCGVVGAGALRRWHVNTR
ncbi:hypothetical protein MMC12_007043 [Toensbergia leucococca]|nr:hypothetical protein [Toensbergia leucococca]